MKVISKPYSLALEKSGSLLRLPLLLILLISIKLEILLRLLLGIK